MYRPCSTDHEHCVEVAHCYFKFVVSINVLGQGRKVVGPPQVDEEPLCGNAAKGMSLLLLLLLLL